jgi:hypothetical protein
MEKLSIYMEKLLLMEKLLYSAPNLVFDKDLFELGQAERELGEK